MYNFKGNTEYEKLDKLLQNSVVLSEGLKQKIYGIMLWASQKGGANKETGEIIEAIVELRNDLLSLTIFQPEFVFRICNMLSFGLGEESVSGAVKLSH